MLVTDGFSNLLSLSQAAIGTADYENWEGDELFCWYRDGGIASTIVDFWPGMMASGLELEISILGVRTSEKTIEDLKQWLLMRFEEIKLLSALRTAEVQCHLMSSAPIVMSGNNVGKLDKLTLFDPNLLQLQKNGKYKISNSTTEINAESILVLNAKTFGSHRWPLVDKNTRQAAIDYENACRAATILIERKNYLVMGIASYLDNMSKVGNEAYSAKLIAMVKTMQATATLMGVQLVDLDKMNISTIERNLSGVDALIDRLRDALLASTNNIPESRLFGRARTGGISAANDDAERTDSEADRLFQTRWQPLIRQVITILLMEKNVNALVRVGRVSTFVPRPIDVARARLINAQAMAAEG
jgi:hypothetical protein